MSDSPPSPKRRHILSSLNPERPSEPRHRSRDEAKREFGENKPADDGADRLRPRPSRLKLKKPDRDRHRSRSRSRSSVHNDDDPSGTGHHRHRRRRRHHRRHRSPTSPDIPRPAPLDPETAFRESLFDALADDEAALHWEHVYGQPIHVYSNQKVGRQGELERMTDDEYAAYVRQKMYEKTHAGLLEEKARCEEQRKQRDRERREKRTQREEDARRSQKLQEDLEESLRRGKARRQRRAWAQLWKDYTDAWATWDGDVAKLPWPVEGGRRRDLNEEDVRIFFTQGLDRAGTGDDSFVAQLKEERVRWHPDKIQQRLGGNVDSELMRDVTAMFQIIDGLWGEARTDDRTEAERP